MPILDFLDKWDLKKHGITGLVVAVIFTAYELFAPKDPSCTEANKYLQKENTAYREWNMQLLRENMNLKQKDSTFTVKAVLPAKVILKKKEDEN